MDLDEAKQVIIRQLATMTEGKCLTQHLRLLLESKLGNELYRSAVESLEKEWLIKSESRVYGRTIEHYWVLTPHAIEQYSIRIKEFIPEKAPASPSGMLRVVGTGGQTLDYVTAPGSKEVLIMCIGFFIVAALIILFATM